MASSVVPGTMARAAEWEAAGEGGPALLGRQPPGAGPPGGATDEAADQAGWGERPGLRPPPARRGHPRRAQRSVEAAGIQAAPGQAPQDLAGQESAEEHGR